MSNQDRFDELDLFIDTLKNLRDKLKSEDLKQEINCILYDSDYGNELKELEEILNLNWEDENISNSYEEQFYHYFDKGWENYKKLDI